MSDLTITRIESSVKGGLSASLGPRTLFVGANGSGKSAYTQAVELATSATASDITGRGVVSAAHMLTALAGGGVALFAAATFSDGAVSRFSVESGKEAEFVPAHPVQFPIRDVVENLTGSADKAREFLLNRAALTVSRADVLKRLGDMVEAYEDAAKPYVGMVETTILQRVLDRAEKDARDRAKEAKTIRSMGASLSNGLPPEPTEAQIAEAEEEERITTLAWETAVRDHAGHVSAASLEALRAEAAGWVARFQEMHSAVGEPVNPPSDAQLAAVAQAEKLAPICAMHEGAAECLVCGGDAADAVRRGQLYTAGVAKTREKNSAYWAQQDRSKQAEAARQRALAAVQEVQAAEASPAYEGVDPAEARAVMEQARLALSTLRSALQKYESVRSTEVQARAVEASAKVAEQLAAACSDAVAGLLSTAVSTLQKRVQAYLPATDTFILRLKEGQKDVCKFGFERNGRLDTALSGAEWARLLVAIACAVSEGKTGLNIFIPPDRAFDPDTLRAVLVALAKAPGQVLFCSPIRPSGKIPAGWTLVEVGEAKAATPRKRTAPEEQAAPRQLDNAADDALTGLAQGLSDGVYTISGGTVSDSGGIPIVSGADAPDGTLKVEGNFAVDFIPAQAEPVPEPSQEETAPERPAEVVQNDSQFADACKNLGFTAAQVKKMNPNAIRYAALNGLDPKSYSIIADGSIFDVVKGRTLAATTPKARPSA